MSYQIKKKEKKEQRVEKQNEGETPQEESHQEDIPANDDPTEQVYLAEEEGETPLLQSESDKEKAPEMGRGNQSSDLIQTQELLTCPARSKVSQYAKRVTFWLLCNSKIDGSGRHHLNVDKSWTLLHKVYTNNPDDWRWTINAHLRTKAKKTTRAVQGYR